MTESTIHKDFWCYRVRTCFDTFVKNPSSLQHLLLFGPPGSGKTTSAQWLVSQIWKQQKALMCISMNAADERSLEAIRQKIFPFLRASWDALQIAERDTQKPRFIILDECETLTEAAQLSLQTILDKDPKEVCVILICNSQSRIHQKLRQRLLRIRYDPPKRFLLSSDTKQAKSNTPIPREAFHEITRGDLRLTGKRHEIEGRLWFYIHHHPDEILDTVRASNTDYMTILTEILLLMNLLFLLDERILETINITIPLIYANTNPVLVQNQVKQILSLWQQKFDEHIRS
jgi:ATPase family associated with various cellular activities (AAA)